jgi:hypothetical protein
LEGAAHERQHRLLRGNVHPRDLVTQQLEMAELGDGHLAQRRLVRQRRRQRGIF